MFGVNPLNHPVCFSEPSRVAMSAWIGHVPFGMYIISALRPRFLVELGTHYGVSYCAFCQAVKESGLDTRCYAVDTWEGDSQAGFYGPEVLAELEEHHNPRYASFSRLIQSSFDDALNHFADATIDLLHIDGYHSYEAVKADVEKWLPKMSNRGMILFHDINVRERKFGVWKLWAELKLQYSSFEFLHSHGLGVLAVGQDYPPEVNALLNCSEKEALGIRQFFSQLGTRLEAQQKLDEQIREKEAALIAFAGQLEVSGNQRNELMRQHEELTRQHEELTRQHEELTRQREELTGQREELTRQCDSLVRQCQELTKKQGELERESNDQKILIDERDAQLRASIAQTEKNHFELLEQTQQIIGLKQDLNDRDLKLQSAALQIREWEQRTRELAHLLAGIKDIRHTGSYRLVRTLSSPLRLGKEYQKRIARLIRRANGSSPNQMPSLNSEKDWYLPGSGLAPNNQISAEGVGQPTISDFHMSLLFDAEWYLQQNPDVAGGKLDPFKHYLRLGAKEGRAPHPLFDPKFYLKTYPEAAIDGGAHALQHYLTRGWKKGYKPNAKFDPSFYLAMYPDIAEAGVEPLTHFITNGLREGRCASPDDVNLEAFEAEFEIPREPIAGGSTVQPDVKAIAFYLPQFHPIPENDKWWGTGFTEWTNVRRGVPQFKDHYQPHVPSDLDYYDLREAEIVERQTALARAYGVYGFCFYYYWFGGKVLLDLPIRRMMETGKPDFPFCICWANENWTRRWDGQENEVLIAQQHSPEDDLAFLHNVENILLHKNYIRVEGKPILIVYQPSLLPDAQATAARWRAAFRSGGHGEIFLAVAQTFADQTPPQEYGFDAVIQFPPHVNCAPITGLTKGLDKSFSGHIYDYNQTKWTFIDELDQLSSSRRVYPGVMPSWDNTARRRNKSNIWINSSPESYYDWLWQVTNVLRRTRPKDERFVFINAWNEWAEGCHLEPDQVFGYAWLNATRLALQPEGTAPID